MQYLYIYIYIYTHTHNVCIYIYIYIYCIYIYTHTMYVYIYYIYIYIYSAGSIPKYRSIAILAKVRYRNFSGIAILRYFLYRTPTVRYLRYFDTRHRVHSTKTKSMRRRNIVVDDDVVYGSYHYSASQSKLT